MRGHRLSMLSVLSLPLLSWGCAGSDAAPGGGPGAVKAALAGPTGRAVAHLAREVPRWPAENRCFSCHHNGDAARALFAARRLGGAVPDASLESTLAWLSRPAEWDEQKGDPAFSDKTLAALQFAAALAAASEAGLAGDPRALAAASARAVALQSADGAWVIEPRGALGSPATWGTHLATAITLRALEAADADRRAAAIERARAWLRAAPARNVHEAAAVLLGLGSQEDSSAGGRAAECLGIIERGRAPNGGWGPYVNSPSEIFDTALVLLALERLPRTGSTREWIRQGRAFLIAAQHPDGGWAATTRPRGGESYAQSTSTAAWASLALLLTGGD